MRTILTSRAGLWRRLRRAGVVFSLAALVACDFDVTNPGPVQSEYLDDPAAFPAQVTGMGRSLSGALNYIVFHGAIVTRELFPTGQTGQFGVEPQNIEGFLTPEEQGVPWSEAQRARWLAEEGLERFRAVLGESEFNSSKLVAQAYLWAGYINRTLGENMCQAVFNGGAPEPATAYLTRAEEQFTQAIQIGTAARADTVITAAHAGRAAVRVHLGNWAGAVADAALVPPGFVYKLPYYNVGDEYQYNRTYWASTEETRNKAHSVWGTVYEQYFRDTKDPRTPWVQTDKKGTGAIQGIGPVNWYPQTKYADRTAAINLSSGREMRLIEAEAKLRDGDWQTAMSIINALRADKGVAPWTATDLAQAWTYLKRERGIELWLEARRLGDLRRWKENSTPGELSPLEVPGSASYLKGQDLCFPISRAEIDTNPNIPKS